MLTPRFMINQDETHLTVLVFAPYSNIKDAEVDVNGNLVTFSAKPYYLRLNLPDNVVDDDTCSAKYDADAGSYSIRLRKEEAKHFEGLEMISELLRPPKTANDRQQPAIEEVDSNAEYSIEDENEDFEWFVQQLSAHPGNTQSSAATSCCPVSECNPAAQTDAASAIELSEQLACIKLDGLKLDAASNADDSSESTPIVVFAPKYGFAGNRQGNMQLGDEPELCEAFDLRTPEVITDEERSRLAYENVLRDFDPEAYLADTFDEERLSVVQDALQYRICWRSSFCDAHAPGLVDCAQCFTEQESAVLRRVANRRRVLVDRTALPGVLYGLVDLLLAAAFNERVCGGESTCESGWTVRKLAGCCSCLLTYNSLSDVLVSFARRVLTYSAVRNWQLVVRCVRDVERLLESARRDCEAKAAVNSGRLHIVRTLVRIYRLFERDGPSGNVLNDLLIADYIVFAQRANLDRHCGALADALATARHAVSKSDLRLEIEEYELGAQLAIQEAESSPTEKEDTAE